MANLQPVVALFESFKKAFDAPSCDVDKCVEMLDQLKLHMTRFTALPPLAAPPSPTMQQELMLAREILEHAAFWSIRQHDIPAFERYVSQLKIFYNDFATALPPSQRQYPILGLNLLRLLAQNRTAEFHTELELIPAALHDSNVYIKYPTQLEQYIMEGSFNKVLNARADGLYSREGEYFMQMLTDTVREEIANCSEKAYRTMSAEHACKMLLLPSLPELTAYANKRGWVLSNGLITFQESADKDLELPSMRLIHETLSYAKELERIV
jgi:26S proteasome regulatory subunit N12